jgi:hypothetical protein
VLAGCALAILAFAYLVVTGHDPVTSFITALVADGAVIVVTGIAERRWQGDKVKQGSVGPDGVNVTFEDSIAEAVEQVNDRVDRHVADLNQALRDVERGFNERLVSVERALSARIRTIEQSRVVPSAEPQRGDMQGEAQE